MITISHIKKEYPLATPLIDCNAVINDGEIVSIIGPSGTGKSTLLRCINMLETPTSGQIIIDGVDITQKGCPLHEIRQNMGMVFQSFNLFSHMNVIENVMHGPVKLQGLSRQQANTRAEQLLELVELSEKKLAYPDELSGGQKQRVAIARALAMHPKILLLDEPTSALDPAMTTEIECIIKKLSKRGLTMLIVTHEMRFARNVSTRVFYMDQGLIYEDGTPEQIFDNPQKELTKIFVQNLKVFEKTLLKRDFDFQALINEISEFANRHMMPSRIRLGLYTVFEEMYMNTMMPQLADELPVSFSLEYSDRLKKCMMDISWKGNRFNPFEDMDALVSLLLGNAIDNKQYEYEADENRIHCTLG